MRQRQRRLTKRVRRVVENKPITFKKTYNMRDPGLNMFDIASMKDDIALAKGRVDRVYDVLFRPKSIDTHYIGNYLHTYVIFRKMDNEKVVRVYRNLYYSKYEVGQKNQYGWEVLKVFEQYSLYPLETADKKTYIQMTYDDFLKSLNSDQLQEFNN